MTGDKHTNSGPEPGRAREFDEAIDELNACVDQIRAMLPKVHAAIERRVEVVPRPRARPRIIYGGGPSAFARRPHVTLAPPAPVGTEPIFAPREERPVRQEPPVRVERPSASAPRQPGPVRSSRQLVVAAELAFAGYTREQIGTRLSVPDDPDASLAIADAFE